MNGVCLLEMRTFLKTNIYHTSHPKGVGKMSFLSHWWNAFPWRVPFASCIEYLPTVHGERIDGDSHSQKVPIC